MTEGEKVKNKSIKKNFIYNSILTSANIVFPLITAPYLSYTLGAENIGKVNFATSIVNWFILISSFGIPRYGIREIARNRDNKKELTNTFWNLILIQASLSIIAIIVYLLAIFNVPRFESELNIHLMMVMMLILNVFSIDWFYQGIEEYSYITIRNIAFKIISIILMFAIVKNSDDYMIYAGINIFGLCFNNVLNYLNTKKYIDKKMYKLEILTYLKELRIYFFTTLIIALYTQLDQLFIGYGSEQHLAFYLRSKTILGIGLSITNSLITVLIPRTAYLIKNDYEAYKKVISKSINYIYIIGLPCIVGIFLLSREIMIFLGGEEFIPASYSLKIISVLIVVNAVGSWQVNQILIPYRKENVALKNEIEETANSSVNGDLELMSSQFELDFRLFEIEMNLDMPMMAMMRGVKSMAMTVYQQAKTLILAGKYEREDMEYKLNRYKAAGRIAVEEYEELIALMDARDLVD